MAQPLLRDLIDIPESLHKGDFVLKLAEGVEHGDETLRQYVVTDKLRENFDAALGHIRKALEGGTSQATYLDGSFGSGKSHFMAVLHLLLQHDRAARSVSELAGVLRKHDDWLRGRKFLLVPFHMIGSQSFTATVLGGYANRVQELHPDAPAPGFYRGDDLLDDADKLRRKLGDETFFADLGGGSGDAEEDGDGWGDLDAAWTAERYDAARAAHPGDPERQQLISELIATHFSAYASVIEGQGEAFLDADDGLAELSRHAKGLGYDGVVLFLDELILWLASRVSDQSFVDEQIQSVIKLVEYQDTDRPVPIISFVARQRDLAELVGEHVPGADKVSFRDQLKHWEGRFDKIQFEDRDLATIAEKRLLRPRSDEARAQIDEAFQTTLRVSDRVREVWLGSEHTRDDFRRVYPFTPALLQVLVALSSLLQRQRTAIKVMMQLLVDRRDTLRLGELVPVGDVYGAIDEEADPFTEATKQHYDRARRLYRNKLRPLLESQHGLSRDQLRALPPDNAKRRAFEGHDRLMRTLLLAAMAPETGAFKGLTAQRLVALNHGSIQSDIPGQEAADTLDLCRRWAAQVHELRVGSGDDPTISLEISEIDLDEILQRVETHDQMGERQRRARALLFDGLGLGEADSAVVMHEVQWRGTPRKVEVVFTNVRLATRKDLEARPGTWKVVFDFPFDEPGYTAQDDLAKVDEIRGQTQTDTVVWLPSFWSLDLQKRLGDLVKVDFLLRGTNLERNTTHLSAEQRHQARLALERQQQSLRDDLERALLEAYGLRPGGSSTLSDPLAAEDQLQSLRPTIQPRLPAANDLASGLEKLLDSVLSAQHPNHPDFGDKVTPHAVRKVWSILRPMREEGQERREIDKRDRDLLRRIVNPLGLANMAETHLVPGGDWLEALQKRQALAAKDGDLVSGPHGPEPSVGDLRQWIRSSSPLGAGDPGLPELIEDLLVLDYAAATQRQILDAGVVVQPEPGKLRDEMRLRQQPLPDAEAWRALTGMAADLLGLADLGHCNLTSLQRLRDRLRDALRRQPDLERFAAELTKRCDAYGVGPKTKRRQSVSDALRVLDAIQTAVGTDDLDALVRLPAVPLDTHFAEVGRLLTSAAELRAALTRANWSLIETAEQRRDGGPLRRELVEALESTDVAVSLVDALRNAESTATQIVAASTPPTPTPPAATSRAGRATGQATGLSLAAARERLGELEALDDVKVDLTWTWRSDGETAPTNGEDD